MYKIYADGELLCDSRIDELALISPNGSLAANVAGEFSFTIPSTHPKYNLIKIKSTVVRIFRDDEKNPMMEAIAVSESIDFFKNRTIQCEGALSFLNDTVLRPSLRNGYTVEQLLTAYINEHNAQVGQKKKFCIGRITVSTSNLIYTSTNMTSTFEQIKSDLLDDLGGYMMVRYEDGERFIDYLATAVETCEQKIELGKNLLDYKSNIDSENFATRVIPLGAALEDSQQTLEGVSQRLTISSVNGGRDFVCNTEAEKVHDVTEKTIVFDDVTDPAELMAEGDAYLRSIQFRDVYIEAKAIDFGYLTNKIQKFSLLKRVNVLSSAHGLDGYFMLTKMDFELNSPENDVFVFGSTEAAKMQSSKTLSAKSQETIHEVENQIEEIHEDVGGLKVTLEKTDEGLLAEVSNRQNADNEMSTRISQTAHSVSILASGSGNTAGITIALYDENGNLIDTEKTANITITGFVSFQDLANAGQTTINGANITTGIISADMIDTENLVAKNGNFTKSFNVEIPISGSKNFVIRAQSDELCFIGREEYDSGLGGNLIYGIYFKDNKAYYAGDSLTGEIATKEDIPDMSKYVTQNDIPVTGFSGDDKEGVYNSIRMDGTVIKGSKISYSDLKSKLSDERLKRDIYSITLPAIEDFYMNLIPTRHKYKNGVGIGEDGKYQFGVIAQWTEKDMIDHAIDPNSYSIVRKSKPFSDTAESQYTDGDDVYRVDYDQFHALHIYMIQKQQKEIEQLKSDNFALKGEVDILKQRLGKMEEMLNVINSKIN